MNNKGFKFKNGDRVKLVECTYGNQEFNPIWDGKFGKVGGTVTKARHIYDDPRYRVSWDNGKTNGMYYENMLDHLSCVPEELFEI